MARIITFLIILSFPLCFGIEVAFGNDWKEYDLSGNGKINLPASILRIKPEQPPQRRTTGIATYVWSQVVSDFEGEFNGAKVTVKMTRKWVTSLNRELRNGDFSRGVYNESLNTAAANLGGSGELKSLIVDGTRVEYLCRDVLEGKLKLFYAILEHDGIVQDMLVMGIQAAGVNVEELGIRLVKQWTPSSDVSDFPWAESEALHELNWKPMPPVRGCTIMYPDSWKVLHAPMGIKAVPDVPDAYGEALVNAQMIGSDKGRIEFFVLDVWRQKEGQSLPFSLPLMEAVHLKCLSQWQQSCTWLSEAHQRTEVLPDGRKILIKQISQPESDLMEAKKKSVRVEYYIGFKGASVLSQISLCGEDHLLSMTVISEGRDLEWPVTFARSILEKAIIGPLEVQ